MYLKSVLLPKLISKTIKHLLLLSPLFLFLAPQITKAENAEKNVLIIHSYHAKFPWTSSLARGINQHLQDESTEINTFHEFLDAKRYPDLKHASSFLDYIQNKYQDTKIDALMVSDDPGLQLILKVRDRYFTDIPLVFLGINNIQEELLQLPGVTGVFENRDITETILIAKKQTGSEELIVINDTSETGIANLQKIQKVQKASQIPQKITIINDLTAKNSRQELSNITPEVPILLLGQFRDDSPTKALQSFETTADILRVQVKNPIYAVTLDVLDHGIVGGKFLEAELHSAQAAELTNQILQGTDVNQLNPILEAENKWLFDSKELERHNIDRESIPSGSELINLEKSFYSKYRKLVWLIGGSFALTLFIIALLIEIIRKNAINEKILKENELRYRDLARAGASIFWELDTNFHLRYISGDTESVWGINKGEMLGKSLQHLFFDNHQIKFPWETFETIFQARQPMDNLIFKVIKNNPQDNHFSMKEVGIFQLNGKPIYNEKNQFIGYRGIQREVTTEFNLSQKIAYQATYDSLTGSINRREFGDRLKALVDEASVSQQNSVLCFLDLDRFKPVNDTAGHLVGDSLLAELAKLLQSCIREQDTLGRLGGDEFGLLLKGISLSQAKEICEEIIARVEKYQFFWRDRYFTVGVSIGMVAIQSDIDATELLSKADLACYKAKDLGRGRLCIANDQALDLEQDREKMEYIANISQALDNGYFYLVKQPIKAINKYSSYQHYEILLRYNDPTGKKISPGAFIPAAEKYGVIMLIDRWVLEQVIKNYDRYFPDSKTMVSINLSGISLSNEDFIEYAISTVKKANINPQNICFEITETAAISQLVKATEFINSMKQLGVKFALDDFGSGVSSFGYLKNLPVDYLKIDGSLIKNIATEPSDRAIVDAINCIAQIMGMETIAEFVENPEILAILAEIGINYAQGYGVGKPVVCDSLKTVMN